MTALTETTLAEITRAIHYHEEQARQGAGLALQHKVTIGGKLAEARKLLNRDDYRRWAEQEFGWDQRHIRRHLQLWRERTRVSALPAGASLRMALAALKTGTTVGCPPTPTGGYILTGHVAWEGEGEPEAMELVAACTDWRVRRG